MDLNDYIRDVENFPKEGILFKDITPLLNTPSAFRYSVDRFAEELEDVDFDKIGAFDARGFLFGSAVAYKMAKPLFPIRKIGKLPYSTISQKYGLEYGKDEVEIHVDSVSRGQKIVLLDDLLATGGTAKAGAKLVEKLGGEVVSCNFLIELKDLMGRTALKNYNVNSLLKY